MAGGTWVGGVGVGKLFKYRRFGTKQKEFTFAAFFFFFFKNVGGSRDRWTVSRGGGKKKKRVL